MKQCEHIQSLIPDAVHNKASEEERALLLRHIGQCVSCRAEYENLQLLVSDLKQMKTVPVSDAYWNGLLPRIHERIEQRKHIFHIPEAVLRYVLPCSAAVAVTVFMFSVGSHNINTDAAEIHSIVAQLPSDEVQQLNQGDASLLWNEPATVTTDQSTLASADKDVIAQILQDDHKGVYSEYDLTSSLASLSDTDVEGVATILEQDSRLR